MAFPNKPHQNDVRQQQLPPLTGIYPTMNMMLTGNYGNANLYFVNRIQMQSTKHNYFIGFPHATRPLGPRPSHVNPNYKGNRPR